MCRRAKNWKAAKQEPSTMDCLLRVHLGLAWPEFAYLMPVRIRSALRARHAAAHGTALTADWLPRWHACDRTGGGCSAQPRPAGKRFAAHQAPAARSAVLSLAVSTSMIPAGCSDVPPCPRCPRLASMVLCSDLPAFCCTQEKQRRRTARPQAAEEQSPVASQPSRGVFTAEVTPLCTMRKVDLTHPR